MIIDENAVINIIVAEYEKEKKNLTHQLNKLKQRLTTCCPRPNVFFYEIWMRETKVKIKLKKNEFI